MNWIKTTTVFQFFKSTILLNCTICLLPLLFGGAELFNSCFLSIGFFGSLLFKEINRKNEYLFYYNNQISKPFLFLTSWMMTFVLLVLLNVVYHFIIKF
jgi:hypothetical protein